VARPRDRPRGAGRLQRGKCSSLPPQSIDAARACLNQTESDGGTVGPIRRAGRGDLQGEQGQVRAGQEDGAHQGGPRALLLRRVPAQLRLHPTHALRGQRPHGRARAHAGAHPPGLLPPGQGDRTHAHDRPGGEGRQDHRRLRRRPRVPPLQQPQRALSPPSSGDQALLRRL
jgi:hypothetical protein